MKKLTILSLFLLSFVFFIPQTSAFEVRVDDSIKLAAEEVAEGNVYASCSEMEIAGTVNGDVIALCQKINVTGVINGDLIAFGQEVVVSGEVSGSVRSAGTSLTINGKVGRNVNAFASEIIIGKEALIGLDVLLAGMNATVDGSVSGNLHGAITSIKINGKIGQDIDLKIDDAPGGGILLGQEAIVNGNLNYSSAQEIVIESPSSVLGEINYEKKNENKASALDVLAKIVYRTFALLLIGLIIFSLKKKIFTSMSDELKTSFAKTLIVGAAFLFLTPILTIIFAVTIIGLPLALILLSSYLVISALALVFASFYAANYLLKKISKNPVNEFLTLTIGIFLFSILSFIPLLSFLVFVLAIMTGAGSLILKIKKSLYA